MELEIEDKSDGLHKGWITLTDKAKVKDSKGTMESLGKKVAQLHPINLEHFMSEFLKTDQSLNLSAVILLSSCDNVANYGIISLYAESV